MISLDSPVTLLHGAVEDALAFIPDNCVDSVVTDPPYAIDIGGDTSAWDSYSPRAFAQWCESWALECRRIAKPGAWLLAASSARTYHRLACGIEDAGWQVIDGIDWIYARSFPRTFDVAARLLKAGVGPEIADRAVGRVTTLQSHREPFVLARAPLDRSVLHTVAEHGTATLDAVSTASASGAGPSNLVFSHSEFCVQDGDCHLECPVAELGEYAHLFPAFYWCSKPNSAERPRVEVEAGEGTKKWTNIWEKRRWRCRVCGLLTHSYMGNSGTYSAVPHQVCDCADYEPIKANDFVSEISHSTVKPLELMRWMVRLTTPVGGTVLEPFAGSGTTLEAAVMERRRVIAVERDASSVGLTRSRLRRSRCSALDRVVLREACDGVRPGSEIPGYRSSVVG